MHLHKLYVKSAIFNTNVKRFEQQATSAPPVNNTTNVLLPYIPNMLLSDKGNVVYTLNNY